MRARTITFVVLLGGAACRSPIAQADRMTWEEARSALMPMGIDPHANSCVYPWQVDSALAFQRERVVRYVHGHVSRTDRLIVLEEGLPLASMIRHYYRALLLINDRLVVGVESSLHPKVVDIAGSELARWLAQPGERPPLRWIDDMRTMDPGCAAVSMRVDGAWQRFGFTGASWPPETIEEWVVGSMMVGGHGGPPPKAPPGAFPE